MISIQYLEGRSTKKKKGGLRRRSTAHRNTPRGIQSSTTALLCEENMSSCPVFVVLAPVIMPSKENFEEQHLSGLLTRQRIFQWIRSKLFVAKRRCPKHHVMKKDSCNWMRRLHGTEMVKIAQEGKKNSTVTSFQNFSDNQHTPKTKTGSSGNCVAMLHSLDVLRFAKSKTFNLLCISWEQKRKNPLDV